MKSPLAALASGAGTPSFHRPEPVPNPGPDPAPERDPHDPEDIPIREPEPDPEPATADELAGEVSTPAHGRDGLLPAPLATGS